MEKNVSMYTTFHGVNTPTVINVINMTSVNVVQEKMCPHWLLGAHPNGVQDTSACEAFQIQHNNTITHHLPKQLVYLQW